MAKVRAGDIRQLTLNSRELTVKGGDANVNIMLSGFNNEVNPGGNGDHYVTQRRKVPGFSDCPVVLDDAKQDLEYIQSIADAGELVPVTMTLASGIVYAGSLVPTGDIQKATGDGTLALTCQGDVFEQL